jgi:hypothetical protein
MAWEDALDLARIYSVATAVALVREKSELLRAVKGPMRMKLAVGEAKLSEGSMTGEHLGRIVQMRRATMDAVKTTQKDLQKREAAVAALRALKREWESWASEYVDFMAALDSLYRQARRELGTLHLSPEESPRAGLALERILLRAVERGGASDALREREAVA